MAAVAEVPDQPPRRGREQGMVRKALLPRAERPLPLARQQPLDPLSLRAKSLLEVGHILPQRLHFLRILPLCLGRNGLPFFAAPIPPAHLDAALDAHLGRKPPDPAAIAPVCS